MNLGRKEPCRGKKKAACLCPVRKEKVRAMDSWPLLVGVVNLRNPVNHSTAPPRFLSPALNFKASWKNVSFIIK